MNDITNYEQFITELYEGQNLSFLGSVDENGAPNIRAMLRPLRREGIGTIYFSTNTPTHKVRQYRANPNACVYFCDAAGFRGALLTGTVEVLESPEYKALLWQEGDELYYPRGVADPDYCVLRFTARAGRVYSNFITEEFTL